ncbi:MoaD/ThiS family protein [Thaumasiovibrio subtropicus]|uniref:MoaD/ThiS family protein n=1 Tax=Thaumasiovibrio subtropicus TaxID=1891207 RepID=UPI000B364885|nr:MoaD/ThiS family protein [Thaumasiovibrio subtropicus]
MITVRFFASTRELLGTDLLEIEDASLSVAGLRAKLISHGANWERGLANSLVAVNQVMVADEQQTLIAGDEVAFFPPVTGG